MYVPGLLTILKENAISVLQPIYLMTQNPRDNIPSDSDFFNESSFFLH